MDLLQVFDIDDVHGAANFRGGPGSLAVLAELHVARTLAHYDVLLDLEGLGVDPVQHAGGFTGVYRPLAVRADGHAFRLDADVNLGQDVFGVHIHHGHDGVVLVGDVQMLVVRVK